MQDQLNALLATFRTDVGAAQDLSSLDAVRVTYLGQKAGRLTHLLKQLGHLPREERPAAGKLLNEVKAEIETALTERAAGVVPTVRSTSSRADLTLPGHVPAVGTLHPITIVRRELEEIFLSMGYSVEEGPDVETDFHNFEALNFPPDHPARDEQDSFFVGGGRVLRTHT